MAFYDELYAAVTNRTACVGILGLGYVGLPLAVEFAQAGYRVIGLDVDARKVEQVNAGTSYIEDVPDDRVQALITTEMLHATTDYDALRAANVVIICVPTPLKKTLEPDMSYISSAVTALKNVIHEGMLVVLESTTYPGTTEEILCAGLQTDDLRVGETLFVAFSGERIDPGNTIYNVKNTPKVVGGVTADSTELAVALYSSVVEQVVPVSSSTTAETVKLLENTFRMVNIGLVNEMAIMCDRLGLNVWEVINAAATKPFGFMPFYPGPGVGGHCIPIDPHYLSWKLRTLDYHARFIDLATDINTSMPQYVVSKIADALNDVAKPIRGSRVVVLGVAYKPDVNDVRESPALPIINLLQHKGADVGYHDPYIKTIRLDDGTLLDTCPYDDTLFTEADCVVVVTNHRVYDWAHVLDHSPIIVDTRNVYPQDQYDGKQIVRL